MARVLVRGVDAIGGSPGTTIAIIIYARYYGTDVFDVNTNDHITNEVQVWAEAAYDDDAATITAAINDALVAYGSSVPQAPDGTTFGVTVEGGSFAAFTEVVPT